MTKGIFYTFYGVKELEIKRKSCQLSGRFGAPFLAFFRLITNMRMTDLANWDFLLDARRLSIFSTAQI
jgi:hypothetical protein